MVTVKENCRKKLKGDDSMAKVGPKTKITVCERRAVEIYAAMSKPSQIAAYRAAFGCRTKSAQSLATMACRMFRKSQVRAYLQEIQERASKRRLRRSAPQRRRC
jgi:hypothetical protein